MNLESISSIFGVAKKKWGIYQGNTLVLFLFYSYLILGIQKPKEEACFEKISVNLHIYGGPS